MAKLFDRVGQATATTGTGTLTLGSVITDATNGDLATFADMGGVAGDGVNYLIIDGNDWEIGTGTLGGTGPGFTLTRTVAKSKISGTVGTTALTLSGSAKVYSVPANNLPNIMNFGDVYNYGTGNPGDTNFARLKISHAGGTAGAVIGTEAGGAGTAGPLTLQGTSNSNIVIDNNNTDFYVGASDLLRLTNTNHARFKDTALVAWSNGSPKTGTTDTALARNAGGIVEVNTGTAGTLAQLYAKTVRTQALTVATLPSASTAGPGARAFVTDATAPTFGATVAGSGSVATPVYSDGTNWKVG